MSRVWLGLLLLLATSSAAQAQDPLAEAEQMLLTCTNQARSRFRLPALVADPHLVLAARGHSAEMARLNYFDHLSPTPGERFPWDRVNRVGADSDFIAEDLYFAEGYPLADVAALAVNAWLGSPEHRENLLSTSATHWGAGLAVEGSRIFVTEMFAAEVRPFR